VEWWEVGKNQELEKMQWRQMVFSLEVSIENSVIFRLNSMLNSS
jgi:hypothetical protein